MLEILTMMVSPILTMSGSVLLITAAMYIGKLYSDATIKLHGPLPLSSENLAFSVFRTSLFVSIAIAMLGTVNSDFVSQALEGGLGLLFIWLAHTISVKIILPKYDSLAAINKDGNMGIATTLSGFILATGIIAYSSFTGEGPLWTSIVFFLLGQSILLSMSKCYQWTHPKLIKEIKLGHSSSGVLLGGMFVAFSLMLNGALTGDYVSMQDDLVAILASLTVGVFMMFVFVNQVIDLLFVTEMSVHKMLEVNNVGGIIIITMIKIMLAMAIGYVVF